MGMTISNILLESSLGMISVSCLILRIFIGICFMVHGFGKLGWVGPGNLQGFESWLKSLGLPMPGLQARAAMVSEILGGLLITVGLFTRLGLVICFVVMIVAAVIGHKGGGYLITNNPPGNEYTINLAAVLAALFLMGPGYYSIDSWLFL